MFATSNSAVRRIEPNHKEWIPHGYQERAVDFLLDRQSAALFLDPGLGKTSITLAAFDQLRSEGIAKKMLVIAPLRVCQLVWEQEGQEWTQFRHLKFTLLHGSKKKAKLDDDSDIFLINPEGVSWLTRQYFNKRSKIQKWPFDTVVVDELTKFKNSQSVRHKALMPYMPKTARRWGLTGTPIPNGYLDLFGQMMILDGGLSLGQWYTKFRDKYFEADYSGFKYLLRRGATKQIEAAIKPYVLRMAANDYLELPPRIDDIRSVVMPPKARKIYEEMKKEMMAELQDTIVEAGNSAAVYSKLKQMANGAVYAGDGVFEPKVVLHIHDAKIDALEELVEELAGTPLLVGYEFRHDLKRLKKRFGDATPYIGSGVSGAQAKVIEKNWNANKIPLLFAHPASAGHGLNFQKGNAFHIAWFSATWDYELYDQFIKRILRQGNEAGTVFNHIFIVEDTIDNKTREAILQKGFTQDAFCDALNAEIYHTGKTVSPPHRGNEEDTTMVKKLSRRSTRNEAKENEDADEEEEDEEEAPKRSSKRSSKRGGGGNTKRKLRGKSRDEEEYDDDDDDDGEEEEVTRKSSRKKFSKAVRKARDDDDDDDDDGEELDDAHEEEEKEARKSPKRKTTRRPAKKKSADIEEEGDDGDEEEDEVLADAVDELGKDSKTSHKCDATVNAILKRALKLAPNAEASELATLIAVVREIKFNVGI